MAAKYPAFISRHFEFGENLKKTKQNKTKQKKKDTSFPKDFCNEIWFKLGDH